MIRTSRDDGYARVVKTTTWIALCGRLGAEALEKQPGAVNLVAPLVLIQNLLAAMIDHGGSIINVTSDAGRVGYPGWGAYGISKFGLEDRSY